MSIVNVLMEKIQTNIVLLNEAGLDVGKIVYDKIGRVEECETLCYKLLATISPTKCEQEIPWPIIRREKKLYAEFQRKFCQVVKMVNLDHPEANIPNITITTFGAAKGETFMRFLYKLSSFSLETQLKKLQSTEDQDKMLPRQLPSELDKNQSVKLNIVRGAVRKEARTLAKVQNYKESAQIEIEKAKKLYRHMNKGISTKTSELEYIVEELEVMSEMKTALCDLQDSDAIRAYNKETEMKEKKLHDNCKRITHIRDLASRALEFDKREEYCLDGRSLFDQTKMSETVDIRLTDHVKSIRDEVLKKVARGWDEDQLPQQKPLYQEAQVALSQATQNQIKSSNVLNYLTNTMKDHEQSISMLRKMQRQKMKQAKIPSTITQINEEHPINLDLPESLDNSNVRKTQIRPGMKRKSINTVINKKKSVASLTCSYKNKLSQRKNVSIKDARHDTRRAYKFSTEKHEVSRASTESSFVFKIPLATSSPRPGTSFTHFGTRRPIIMEPQAGPSGIGVLRNQATSAGVATATSSVRLKNSSLKKAATTYAPKTRALDVTYNLQETETGTLDPTGHQETIKHSHETKSVTQKLKTGNQEPKINPPAAQEPKAEICIQEPNTGTEEPSTEVPSTSNQDLTSGTMEPSTSTQGSKTNTEDPCQIEPTKMKRPRKSLDDIIKRFYKLKERMNKNNVQNQHQQDDHQDS